MTTSTGPSLRGWLAEQGGAVPFQRFMEAALYDPEFGYYTKRIRSVGRDGDFSTSAVLGKALARAIAAWIREEGNRTPGLRHLIEVGPGSGLLHRDLRRFLGWAGRWRWKSHLVERSSVLREVQKKTLGWNGAGVQWHDHPETALLAAGGKALIFSNELVDAFPVVLLQQKAGGWQEVWLELHEGGRIVETLRPCDQTITRLRAQDFAEGQRVEVHNSFRKWLMGWRPGWKAGTMLTVDYGGDPEEIYYRRPSGTLRGYRQHRRVEGVEIYQNPGSCDLTADVNFQDLIEWGLEAGLRPDFFGSQARFLSCLTTPRTSNDLRLADEADAGGSFKCLVQRLETESMAGPAPPDCP